MRTLSLFFCFLWISGISFATITSPTKNSISKDPSNNQDQHSANLCEERSILHQRCNLEQLNIIIPQGYQMTSEKISFSSSASIQDSNDRFRLLLRVTIDGETIRDLVSINGSDIDFNQDMNSTEVELNTTIQLPNILSCKQDTSLKLNVIGYTLINYDIKGKAPVLSNETYTNLAYSIEKIDCKAKDTIHD